MAVVRRMAIVRRMAAPEKVMAGARFWPCSGSWDGDFWGGKGMDEVVGLLGKLAGCL